MNKPRTRSSGQPRDARGRFEPKHQSTQGASTGTKHPAKSMEAKGPMKSEMNG